MTKCVVCDGSRPEWTYHSVTVREDTFIVCDGCASQYDGPGRGEGIDEDDRALAAVLEHLAGISSEDHFLSDEWNGYAGVFDRHILIVDGQGFVDVRTFRDHESAMREMNRWEDAGMGACEDDAWIGADRGRYSVSFDGRYVDTFDTLSRAKACVSVLMRKHGYFPTVWLDMERGNIRRIDVW